MRSPRSAAAPRRWYGPHVLTTVREEGGLEPLRSALRERMRTDRPMVHITLPAKDGRTLAEVYREGEVLERRQNGRSIELTARVPAAVVGRWRRKQSVRASGVVVHDRGRGVSPPIVIVGEGRVGLSLAADLIDASGRR